jgi:hypothetical protein
MVIIPALHDAANDQPVRYTPVCSHTRILVCLNPAYAAMLPPVTAALDPVLSELAGLPGAPARVRQVSPVFAQGPGTSISVSSGVRGAPGQPGRYLLILPDPLPGQQGTTTAQFAATVRADAAGDFVLTFVGGRNPDPAQQAVAAALLEDAGAARPGPGQPARGQPGSKAGAAGGGVPAPAPGRVVLPPSRPVQAAARRFAALPAAVRHAWLATHLTALRAGQLTLAQLP